jgi:acetyl esterase/lipase
MPETITASLPSSQTNPAPELTLYPPESGTANGRALVIFPGGGYWNLAPHEGKGYAEYYVKHGYTCFVVTYRLAGSGHRHPAMLEDAAAAVHTVRLNAKAYAIDPQRIGVMGSSAGGHLAASLMVHYKSFLPDADCRPDFGILCYPVITFGPENAHIGSRNALLGEEADPELVELLSCEKQVNVDTPPCFLWHTAEDPAVPMQNSLLYADALHKNGVTCELHVYSKGRHGLGLETDFNWAGESLRWMDELLTT